MARRTTTGTVPSSGRGGTAAETAQNEQTAEEHSTLERCIYRDCDSNSVSLVPVGGKRFHAFEFTVNFLLRYQFVQSLTQ